MIREDFPFRKLSKTSLSEFMESPAHYLQYLQKPKSYTTDKVFGSMVDHFTLTPEAEHKFVVLDNIDLRTTTGKEKMKELEEQHGIILKIGNSAVEVPNVPHSIGVTKESYDKAMMLADKIRTKAKAYLENGTAQNIVESVIGGLPFIGFEDYYLPGLSVELKTAQCSRPDKFARDAADYKYPLQDAIYMYQRDVQRLYIVAEKSQPYNIMIMEPDEDWIKYGKILLRKAVDDFNLWLDTYGSEPIGYEFTYSSTLRLPPWIKVSNYEREAL